MRTFPNAVAVGLVVLAIAAFAEGADAPAGGCGDPNGDNAVTASDALYVLRSAVGIGTCDLSACDADGSGGITAQDALVILRFAVASPASLNCQTTSSTHQDECFKDSDCDPEFGQAGPYCCGYHCCECDGDDSQCGEGKHCEGEVCVLNQATTSSTHRDECFKDSDCDPEFGQAGPYCCGYHCCECDDGDDNQCGDGKHCEGEVCVPNP